MQAEKSEENVRELVFYNKLLSTSLQFVKYLGIEGIHA